MIIYLFFNLSFLFSAVFKKNYSKKKISISIITVIALLLAAIFIYYSCKSCTNIVLNIWFAYDLDIFLGT